MGAAKAAPQATMHTPWAELHARIAAGTPRPPVLTPATPPAPPTQATQRALHPDIHIPIAIGPAEAEFNMSAKKVSNKRR